MEATLRRAAPKGDDAPEVATDHFRLDLAGHRAFVGADGTEVRLTPIEWVIVRHLVQNAERLVTYKQLVESVWFPNYDPDQSLVRVHMGHIRRKLEADPSRPTRFITDSGMGYRFTP